VAPGVLALRVEPNRRLVQPIGNGAVVGPSCILVDENRLRVEVIQFVPNPDKERRTAEGPQAGVDLAVGANGSLRRADRGGPPKADTCQ